MPKCNTNLLSIIQHPLTVEINGTSKGWVTDKTFINYSKRNSAKWFSQVNLNEK